MGPFSYQYIQASLSYQINRQPLCLEMLLCSETGELTARRHTTPAGKEPCSESSQHAHCQLCPQTSHWLLREHPNSLTILNFTCQDILHINPQHCPVHTSLLGGKSMCVADVSPAALQLLEALRKGEGEGSVQICIARQAMMPLALYNPSAHSKVPWSPANHKTSLKHLSLHVVYRRTASNGTSWSTTLCISYQRAEYHNLLSLSRPKEMV